MHGPWGICKFMVLGVTAMPGEGGDQSASLSVSKKKSEETIRFPAQFIKFFQADCLLLLQIYSVCLAVAGLFQVKRNLLALFQTVHAGRLNGSDVNKNVSATVFWFNEPKSFSGIEPLNCPNAHL